MSVSNRGKGYRRPVWRLYRSRSETAEMVRRPSEAVDRQLAPTALEGRRTEPQIRAANGNSFLLIPQIQENPGNNDANHFDATSYEKGKTLQCNRDRGRCQGWPRKRKQCDGNALRRAGPTCPVGGARLGAANNGVLARMRSWQPRCNPLADNTLRPFARRAKSPVIAVGPKKSGNYSGRAAGLPAWGCSAGKREPIFGPRCRFKVSPAAAMLPPGIVPRGD